GEHPLRAAQGIHARRRLSGCRLLRNPGPWPGVLFFLANPRAAGFDRREQDKLCGDPSAVAQDHYDSRETRDPEERERDLFTRLPAAITRAMSATGWARQLARGAAPAVTARAAVARPPRRHPSDLPSA